MSAASPAGEPERRFPGPDAPRIAVIGGANAPAAAIRDAEAVGSELARRGAVLVCGGLSGIMEAACRGAARAGGFTIGILPGTDRRAGNRWLSCAIPTGLGHFRNFLVVQAADAVIALPGASGTLSEAAMARTLGKRVVGLRFEAGPLRALPAESPEAAVRIALADASE